MPSGAAYFNPIPSHANRFASANPVVSAAPHARVHFGQAADVFSGTPNASASQVHFGGIGGQAASKLKGVGALFKYLADKENRIVLKSLLYQYVIPGVLGLSLLTGPLGWALAAVGLPISMALAWRGEKLMEKAVQKVHSESGKNGRRLRPPGRPLDRIAALNKIWFDTSKTKGPGYYRDFIPEYNRLMKDLITETNGSPAADKVRKALSINPRSRFGHGVEKALKVKVLYKNAWYARGMKSVTGLLRKVPFLKPVGLALSIAANALFLLLNYRRLGSVIIKNGARII